MAVFTRVSHETLARWLAHYDAGALVAHEGITSGIENTNYFVTTSTGHYVLTLFERLSAQDLAFHLGLQHHLATRGIPCPDPVFARDGDVLGELAGKPAALFPRLPGSPVMRPLVRHCRQLGETLAQMHLASANYEVHFANPRGRDWWRAIEPKVRPYLSPAQRALLDDELEGQHAFAQSAAFAALAASAVHADLFRDNVFFAPASGDAARLSGIIDFGFAGVDHWLFDLAVAVNDWCVDDRGELDAPRLDALLAAYRDRRPFEAGEREAWPMMLRAAALRFWLSRLFDRHCPRPAEIVVPKDPAPFERILRLRRAASPALA